MVTGLSADIAENIASHRLRLLLSRRFSINALVFNASSGII